MHPLDYAILGFYLLVILLVGVYFSRSQRTGRDYFVAGRSMEWLPVGLSLMATLFPASAFMSFPGEGYYVGWKLLILPFAAWLTLPLVTAWVLPLYRRLEIDSVYEYLELRFDALTRRAVSTAFLVWRLLWLAVALYVPCKSLEVAADGSFPAMSLVLVLGAVATLYTFLGGMKAVLWTDVLQTGIIFAGVAAAVGAAWWNLDGGPDRVRDVAESLGRAALVDSSWSWSERWSVWGLAPYFFLTLLAFYMADQITVQRYFAAKDVNEARRAFAVNCAALTVAAAVLSYLGLALLAFYQDHPDAMRPNWVVNVDNATRGSITDPATRDGPLLDGRTGRPSIDLRAGEAMLDPNSGVPLIDWREPITPDTVERLVAERRLLRPNTKEPFTSADELLTVDPETGEPRINLARLAMRSPPRGEEQIGEIILHRQAQEELFPWFMATQLPWGVKGLVAAALLAASMAALDSGLNSVAAVLIADFHRRQGWGRKWLARRLRKTPEQLTEADELRIARPLVLMLGAGVTLLTLLAAALGNLLPVMLTSVNTLAGPLLAIFLLGVFTSRTTGRAALAAGAIGVLLTLWLTAANEFAALGWLWPFPQKLAATWPLTLGVAFTLITGYLLSFALGRRKTKEELRGLTLGCGKLGMRQREKPQLNLPHS